MKCADIKLLVIFLVAIGTPITSMALDNRPNLLSIQQLGAASGNAVEAERVANDLHAFQVALEPRIEDSFLASALATHRALGERILQLEKERITATTERALAIDAEIDDLMARRRNIRIALTERLLRQ